jgi:hypothetical protein
MICNKAAYSSSLAIDGLFAIYRERRELVDGNIIMGFLETDRVVVEQVDKMTRCVQVYGVVNKWVKDMDENKFPTSFKHNLWDVRAMWNKTCFGHHLLQLLGAFERLIDIMLQGRQPVSPFVDLFRCQNVLTSQIHI